MALLNWLNADLFTALRDKVNAAIDLLNLIPFRTNDSLNLRIKKINIGDWNMNSTISVTVPHGINYSKLLMIDVQIYNDDYNGIGGGAIFQFSSNVINNPGAAIVTVEGTNVVLRRDSSGIYDNTQFDSTSFNRGIITIIYQA